jgi:peptide-methionine (S)-S-oxide reductase
METIYLGAGCFWCTEAVFKNLRGVISVSPGYIGGHVENPTYEQVCTGETGHVEVAKVEYNKNIISTEELLDVFFNTHDPTSVDRQGADVGSWVLKKTSSNSSVFYKKCCHL